MANWQRKVDFSSYTQQYDNAELSVQEFAKIVAKKLQGLQKFTDNRINLALDSIVQDFEDLAANDEYDFAEDDFNFLLNDLYTWGDMFVDGRLSGKKVCWIQMR